MSEQVAPKERKWLQVALGLLIIAVFAATAWYYFTLFDSFNTENLQAFIRGFGPWAPLVFAILYTISAPIPFVSIVLSPVGGLLFGTLAGTLIVISVATVSSLIPFTMSRNLGQEWGESKLRGKKLGDMYSQSGGERGFIFILMMRLIPLLPWEVQNYVAGLTKIRLPVYLLATVIGIIPGSLGLVLLGDAVADPTSWKFAAAIGLNAIVMVGAPVIATIIRRRKSAQGTRKEPEL